MNTIPKKRSIVIKEELDRKRERITKFRQNIRTMIEMMNEHWNGSGYSFSYDLESFDLYKKANCVDAIVKVKSPNELLGKIIYSLDPKDNKIIKRGITYFGQYDLHRSTLWEALMTDNLIEVKE